jgi:transposase InsO family protein
MRGWVVHLAPREKLISSYGTKCSAILRRGVALMVRVVSSISWRRLRVNRRRLGRMLAQAGLRCKTRRRFKAPTASGQAQTVAPNQRNRDLTVHAPDRVYVGDITYLPTGEGWLYLAVVLDLCSRAVVG